MYSLILIQPALAMLGLTFIVALAMMWTRVNAMKASKVAPEQAEDASRLRELLPRNVMRISDNYNHLHEQPIILYVLCILITLANRQDEFYSYLAWGYVLLRVLHSVTQICIVDVMRRFVLFLLSWLVIGLMLMRFFLQILLY